MKNYSLSKSTFWYALGNIFIRSVNFLLLPFYSNFISPREFGNYALLMSFYAFAMVLYSGGYQSALSNFFLKETDPEKQRIISSTIGKAALVSAALLSAAVILSAKGLSSLITNSPEYSYLIILIAIAMLLETAGAQVLNYLITIQNASKVVLISAAGAAVNFILNIYFLYFLNTGIEGIIYAQLFSAAAVIILFSPLLKDLLRSAFDKALFSSLLRFAYPLIISGLLSIGVDVADRFFLNYHMGKADVGIYSFSYRIALVMNVFVISFRTAWMPYALRKYYENKHTDLLPGVLLKFISAAAFIFITVILLADNLFEISMGGRDLFNKLYKPGIYILPFVLGGYLLNGISSFYSIYPFVSGKTFHFILSDGLAFAVNIIFNIILIPVYGIIGAAFATFMSFILLTGYLIAVQNRHIRFKLRYGPMLTVVLLMLGISAAGYFTGSMITDILLIAVYLFIVAGWLKIKPGNLFKEKGINKVDQLN